MDILKSIKEMFREMKRNDACWCGSGKKYKKCHMDFDERIDEIKYNVNKSQIRPPHHLINIDKDIEKNLIEGNLTKASELSREKEFLELG